MRRAVLGWVAASLLLSGLVVQASAQQTTTETQVRNFEVIGVEGNKLVFRDPRGTHEITVPPDFRFEVDGKPMAVSDLKPGMKGVAKVTTTTTVKPVHVTEVRNAEVVNASGGSVLVRGEKGFQNFTQGDVDRRGVTLYRDGRPARISDLRSGDRLTATIVTEKPPEILTEKQVQAIVAKPAAPAAAPPAAAATPEPRARPAPAEPAADPAPARTLPKTGSPLPLLGLLGAASLGLGMAMTALRRRRDR